MNLYYKNNKYKKFKYIWRLISIAIIFISTIYYSFYKPKDVIAQISSTGIAVSSPVVDKDAKDGDIICTYKEGNSRCNVSYDPAMFGVISDNPSASIEDKELQNARLVISSGIVILNVSSINGNISEGDFVTSSEKAGIGQKASRNGYVVGMALGSYQSDNKDNIGRIQVMVNIHPTGALTGSKGNLLQFIRQGIAIPIFEPLESLRYLLAVAIVIISFTLGMVYFGRASRSGIEAIGRNPLAKKVIQLTVFLNISLTIVIILVGLGIAYLILIL